MQCVLFSFSLVLQRDKHLEEKILHWITHVIHVNENPGTDFDHFLQDGSVLSK